MVLINVNKQLENHYTNDDGDKLFNMIVSTFENGDTVELSFEGIDAVNSSFVNSAFIALLDIYPFDTIRKNLIFKNTNKQINSLILNRFKFEVEKLSV